jgi:hypothetical protein
VLVISAFHFYFEDLVQFEEENMILRKQVQLKLKSFKFIVRLTWRRGRSGHHGASPVEQLSAAAVVAAAALVGHNCIVFAG